MAALNRNNNRNRRGSNRQNRGPFNRNSNNSNRNSGLRNNLSNRRLSNRNNGYNASSDEEELDENGNPIEKDDNSVNSQQKSKHNQNGNVNNNYQDENTSDVEDDSSDSGGGLFKFNISFKTKIIIILLAIAVLLALGIVYFLCAVVVSAFGGSFRSSSIGSITDTNTSNANVALEEVATNSCETVTLINCRDGIDLSSGEQLPAGAEFCKVHNDSDITNKRYFIPNDSAYVHENISFEDYVAGVATAEVGGFNNIVVSQQLAVEARTEGMYYLKNAKAYGLNECTIEYSNLTQVYKSPNALGKTAAASTVGRVIKNVDGEILSNVMFYDAFACGKVNGSKIVTINNEQFYIINQPILRHQLIPKSFVDKYINNQDNQEWLKCDKTDHHGDGASQYGALFLAKEKHYNFEAIIKYYYSDYIDLSVEKDSFNCYSILANDNSKCPAGKVVKPDLDILYDDYTEGFLDANYSAGFGWPSYAPSEIKPSYSDQIWYESTTADNSSVTIYVYNSSYNDAVSYKNNISSNGWNLRVSDYSDELLENSNKEVVRYSSSNSNGDRISLNYDNSSDYLEIVIDFDVEVNDE